MARSKALTERNQGSPAADATVQRSKSRRWTGVVEKVHTFLPLARSIGVVVLIVWSLMTLSKWAGDEAVLETVPRIAVDDFSKVYSEFYSDPNPNQPNASQGHRLYIVDVRGEAAYGESHIHGALSLPEGGVGGVERGISSLVPDISSSVVLYCG